MKKLVNTTLFIDFDSTFSQVEGLEELILLSVKDELERKKIYDSIYTITEMAMNGEIDYMDSLQQRIHIISATKTDVDQLADVLKTKITPSIQAHQPFFIENKDNIYILSNGFKDFIVPVAEFFGLHADHVYANELIYDETESIIDFKRDTPLSASGGKPKVINALNLTGNKIMIGDGFNDYQAKKDGAVDQFIVFTENVVRENVLPYGDAIAKNFSEVLTFIRYD